jgi:hypothetical protein
MGATPATSTDGFVGTIKTLTLNVKANIVRVECTFEDAPDFRALAGNVGFGAGRQKHAPRNRTRLHLSQGRRSKLPSSDLRHAVRGPRPGRPAAHLLTQHAPLTERRSPAWKRAGVEPGSFAALVSSARVLGCDYSSHKGHRRCRARFPRWLDFGFRSACQVWHLQTANLIPEPRRTRKWQSRGSIFRRHQGLHLAPRHGNRQ